MPAVSEARGDGAPEVAGVGEAAADDAAEEEEEDGDGADPGDFGGGAVQVGYVCGEVKPCVHYAEESGDNCGGGVLETCWGLSSGWFLPGIQAAQPPSGGAVTATEGGCSTTVGMLGTPESTNLGWVGGRCASAVVACSSGVPLASFRGRLGSSPRGWQSSIVKWWMVC
ncbi:predicted protein [Chaetomium globosum CBS 148.51]|uniref:Uncharacterized protein n=1 Tax=Chaetomium globosum (strain ATCC 6205 / CBS 148.51 / DSM 1962 / NBRC 6347 / NRRL 1970) TaxID=306901 RepID=Q2H2C1_CHAGB|nr:uncharacterized protein CHGG_04075 [Chaetomium globosum CBS 148.51]EAQ87456.1 predicted protein [Chaetomium globosum CBS 148.51]